jgi:hypothetical protein
LYVLITNTQYSLSLCGWYFYLYFFVEQYFADP